MADEEGMSLGTSNLMVCFCVLKKCKLMILCKVKNYTIHFWTRSWEENIHIRTITLLEKMMSNSSNFTFSKTRCHQNSFKPLKWTAVNAYISYNSIILTLNLRRKKKEEKTFIIQKPTIAKQIHAKVSNLRTTRN